MNKMNERMFKIKLFNGKSNFVLLQSMTMYIHIQQGLFATHRDKMLEYMKVSHGEYEVV